MRLTKHNASSIQLDPGQTERIVFDDALPGFGLRVRAGGKRSWIVQYRVGAKQRRLSLGSAASLDADEARKLAKAALAKAHLGADPQLERKQANARAAITLAAVSGLYLEQATTALKASSLKETERYLRRHWAVLGEFPVHKITRAQVATRLTQIAKESGPIASNRARAALSALYSWAIGAGIAEVNPVVGTNRAKDEAPRDRVLSDAELRAIWNACLADQYGSIVKLAILTGARRDEVGGMAWSEIDLQQGMWRLEGDRTKNALPHDIPLSEAAADILMALPRREGRDLIFGTGDGPFSGWSKAKEALDGRIVKQADGGHPQRQPTPVRPWRFHDLRRTAATRMGDLGVLPHVVEALLNHQSGFRGGVAGVYNRANYSREKRQALAIWADYVAGLANDKTPNVIPLTRVG